VLHAPPRRRPVRLAAKHEILLDRERAEDIAVFRHIADAELGDLVRLEAGYRLALERDRAVRGHVAHDRLQGGRTADAVAPEDADDLPLAHREVDALQHVALAVIGVQTADLEHHAASAPR